MQTIIHGLNELSLVIAPVFYKLLFVSVTGTLVGGVILAIRKAFDKKIPPMWKYLMWGVVIFALLIPIRPASNFSLTGGIGAVEDISYREEYAEIFKVAPPENASGQEITEFQKQQNDIFLKSLLFDSLLPLVWFFGMCLAFLLMLGNKLYLSCQIRASVILAGVPEDIVAECKNRLGINKEIPIVLQSYLKAPALFGLIKPKILLPAYAEKMNRESLCYVLLHELSHDKRKDMLLNYILLFIQAVHWFNPLVWLLFQFVREDMEILNDSAVLKAIGEEERDGYARSLVEVLGLSHKLSLTPRLLCMADSRKNVERRISMIKLRETFQKHKIIVAVCCILVIAGVCVLFLTQKKSEEEVYDISARVEILEIDSEAGTITVKELPGGALLGDNCILSFDQSTKFTAMNENQKEVKAVIGDFAVGDFAVVFTGEVQETYPTMAALKAMRKIERTAYEDLSGAETAAKAISFPAYSLENPVNIPIIEKINATEEFKLIGDFPENWEFRTSNNGEKNLPAGEFYTPVYIYEDGVLIGYIGFNIFEPYDGEIAPEEYYKTVYSVLRLSRFFSWEPYTPVARNEISETGIAQIYYLDETEIDNFGGELPNAPELESKGILSYHKEKKVFVGIAFMPDVVDKIDIDALAKTVYID